MFLSACHWATITLGNLGHRIPSGHIGTPAVAMLAITVMMCGILIRLSTWHQTSTNSTLEPRQKNWSGDVARSGDVGENCLSGDAGGTVPCLVVKTQAGMWVDLAEAGIRMEMIGGDADVNLLSGDANGKKMHLFEGQTCHGAAPTWHPHCHPKGSHQRSLHLSQDLDMMWVRPPKYLFANWSMSKNECRTISYLVIVRTPIASRSSWDQDCPGMALNCAKKQLCYLLLSSQTRLESLSWSRLRVYQILWLWGWRIHWRAQWRTLRRKRMKRHLGYVRLGVTKQATRRGTSGDLQCDLHCLIFS